jgi:hypothetical protein
MNLLTVPKVESYPEQSTDEIPVVRIAGFLLTALLGSSARVLRARDSGGETVAWIVGEEVVAHTPRRFFRSMLAHFGAHYMAGQLYAGYALVELQQDGIRSVCHF